MNRIVLSPLLLIGGLFAALLVGCAQHLPAPQGGQCAPLTKQTLLLQIDRPPQPVLPLLLHVQPAAASRKPAQFIALDTLGTLQFTASVELASASSAPRMNIETSDFYRGPAAQDIVMAAYWWQQREQLTSACAEASGLMLERTSEGHSAPAGFTLKRGQAALFYWQPQNADSVILPHLKTTLTIRTQAR